MGKVSEKLSLYPSFSYRQSNFWPTARALNMESSFFTSALVLSGGFMPPTKVALSSQERRSPWMCVEQGGHWHSRCMHRAPSVESRGTEGMIFRGSSMSSLLLCPCLLMIPLRAVDTWHFWICIAAFAEASKHFAYVETAKCKFTSSCQLYFRSVPNGHTFWMS